MHGLPARSIFFYPFLEARYDCVITFWAVEYDQEWGSVEEKKKSNASPFSFSLANGWDMETANVLSQKLESSFEYTNQPAHPEP